MKLLVFAHTPPPHHGQSFMVEMLLNGLRNRSDNLGSETDTRVECYHVNCRFSEDVHEIGRIQIKKVLLLFKYCLQTLWIRVRYGVHNLYLVPAPGLRSAVYRDWIILLIGRVFFRRIIFHWQAAGLGEWITTQARPIERWLTCRLLGHHDLSIILGDYYRRDVACLSPKQIVVVPNGSRDYCPDFEKTLAPLRSERIGLRRRILEQDFRSALSPGDIQSKPHYFKVLYVSLCYSEKGLFDTLEAVAQINAQLREAVLGVRVQLTVCGKFYIKEEQNEFERRIECPDLCFGGKDADFQFSEEFPLSLPTRGSVVDYRGFVSGEEKDRLFRESDCFCFPTYYSMEGHPVCLVEAMSYGLPLITTRWRAIPDLMPPDYCGMVDAHSPTQVAEAMMRILHGENGSLLRSWFLDKFTEPAFIKANRDALLCLCSQTKENNRSR